MAGDRGGKRKRGGGGDEGSAKRSSFFRTNLKATIPLDSRGFLVSCVTGRERQAAQEAVALLTEYTEEAASTRSPQEPQGSATDFSKLIEDEVSDIKSRKGRVFEWHKTNVNGLLYISLTPEGGAINPVELVTRIAQDVKATKQCKSRLCMRFLPIEAVCHAKIAEIRKASEALCKNAFPSTVGTPSSKFAVQYEHRASVSLKRAEVIDAVVDAIPQPPHVVNLSQPDKTIIVQLIKNFCAMSVVGEYKQLGKFNLRELSISEEEKAVEGKAGDSTAAQGTAADTATDGEQASPKEPLERAEQGQEGAVAREQGGSIHATVKDSSTLSKSDGEEVDGIHSPPSQSPASDPAQAS